MVPVDGIVLATSSSARFSPGPAMHMGSTKQAMPIQDPKMLSVPILPNVRAREVRSLRLWRELKGGAPAPREGS